MHRFRLAILGKAHGQISQYFSTKPVTFKGPTAVITQPRYRSPPIEQTLQSISMNPINIINYDRTDNENDYIYKYVKRILDARLPQLQVKNIGIHVIKKLNELDQQLQKQTSPHLSEDVSNIRQQLCSYIQTLSRDQLTALLEFIKDINKTEYKQLIRVIDIRLRYLFKEESLDLSSKDLDSWLRCACLIYESKIRSSFTNTIIGYLASDANIQMTDEQLVLLLFLVMLTRSRGVVISKFENRILRMINKANIEQLAIISMAYFKTRTSIHNPLLLTRLINRTRENLHLLDPKEPAYCSIIKSIRYSRTPNCRDSVEELVSSLAGDKKLEVIFASPYNAVHTIKLMEAFRVRDSRLLHTLRHVLFKRLDEFRIKDIQYGLTSLSNMSYMNLEYDQHLWNDFDKLADVILDGKRIDNGQYQNYHLIPILRALAVFGYYNGKLLSHVARVMSDQSCLNHMRDVLEFEKSVLLVHTTYSVEASDQTLNCIQPLLKECANSFDRNYVVGSVKKDLIREKTDKNFRNRHKFLQNGTKFREIARNLANTDQLISDDYDFIYQNTFSHQNYPDLVVTRRGFKTSSYNPTTLLPVPVEANSKACIIYAIQNTDFIDGKSLLCGYKQLMMRMFVKLGYEVLAVDLHNPDVVGLKKKIIDSLG